MTILFQILFFVFWSAEKSGSRRLFLALTVLHFFLGDFFFCVSHVRVLSAFNTTKNVISLYKRTLKHAKPIAFEREFLNELLISSAVLNVNPFIFAFSLYKMIRNVIYD